MGHPHPAKTVTEVGNVERRTVPCVKNSVVLGECASIKPASRNNQALTLLCVSNRFNACLL